MNSQVHLPLLSPQGLNVAVALFITDVLALVVFLFFVFCFFFFLRQEIDLSRQDAYERCRWAGKEALPNLSFKFQRPRLGFYLY